MSQTSQEKNKALVLELQGWQPDAAPGFGRPLGERMWINPSCNAPTFGPVSDAKAACQMVVEPGRRFDKQKASRHVALLHGSAEIFMTY